MRGLAPAPPVSLATPRGQGSPLRYDTQPTGWSVGSATRHQGGIRKDRYASLRNLYKASPLTPFRFPERPTVQVSANVPGGAGGENEASGTGMADRKDEAGGTGMAGGEDEAGGTGMAGRTGMAGGEDEAGGTGIAGGTGMAGGEDEAGGTGMAGGTGIAGGEDGVK